MRLSRAEIGEKIYNSFFIFVLIKPFMEVEVCADIGAL